MYIESKSDLFIYVNVYRASELFRSQIPCQLCGVKAKAGTASSTTLC